MVYVSVPLSIDFPETIPINGISDKLVSKTPVIKTHPKIASIIQIIFPDVIFSLNNT